MNFREVAIGLNAKKLDIDYEVLKNRLEYYRNLKATSLLKLRDLGFNSGVVELNISEFLKCLTQEARGMDTSILFSAKDGTLNITSETVSLLRAKNRLQPYIEDNVLGYLYDYCIAYERIPDLEVYCSKFKVPTHQISITEAKFYSKDGLVFSDSSILECFINPEDYKALSIKTLRYTQFLLSIGIDIKQITEHKNQNKGIVFKDLTFKDEINNLNCIINFDVVCTTKFVQKYNEARIGLLQGKANVPQKVMYQTNFLAQLGRLVEEVMKEGVLSLEVVTPDLLIFKKISRKESVSPLLKNAEGVKVHKKTWCNCGLYVLDWYRLRELPEVNKLLGVSGEFIRLTDYEKPFKSGKAINKQDVVKLYDRVDGVLRPIEFIRVNTLNLQLKVGSTFEFEYTDFETFIRCSGIGFKGDSYEEAFDYLFEYIKIYLTKTEAYKGIVGAYYAFCINAITDMTVALICSECGIDFVDTEVEAPKDKIVCHSRINKDDIYINHLYKDNNKLFIELAEHAEKMFKLLLRKL